MSTPLHRGTRHHQDGNKPVAVDGVFKMKDSLKNKINGTEAHEKIQITSKDLEAKVGGYIEKVAKIKYEHQIKLEQQYEKEFYEVKLDYDKYIEANNEDDLYKELEQEKNETINERSRLLQNTFNMSLVLGEKKQQLKMTEREDEEQDEELKFLMEQIDIADNEKLRLMERIEAVNGGKFYPVNMC